MNLKTRAGLPDAYAKNAISDYISFYTEALPSKAGRFSHQNGFQCSS